MLSPGIYGGTLPYTYSWSPSTDLSCITCLNPTATATITECYSLTVTDSNACTATNAACVVVKAISPKLTAQTNDSICNGAGVITLFGSPNGGTYSGYAVHGNFFYPDSAHVNTFDFLYYTVTSNGCTGVAKDSLYVYICTGTEQLTTNGQLTIFPNPNNGKFTIQSSPGTRGHLSVEVYNVLGEKVFSKLSPSEPARAGIVHYPLSIDLSGQPGGIYLCRLLEENGELVREIKFVIE
jgi:hypothetical protein